MCGKLYIKSKFHNPRKRGKPGFTLTVEHAALRDLQDCLKNLDPRDKHEISFVEHECDYNKGR